MIPTKKLLCCSAIGFILVIMGCYHEVEPLEDSIARCADSDTTHSNISLDNLVGSYKLAVSASQHDIFPMGDDRTEYEFVICPDGKITIANQNKKVFKTFFYTDEETKDFWFADEPQSIGVENFYEDAPFREKFNFTIDNSYALKIWASYETYNDLKTQWSNSPYIRGKKVPAEVNSMAGEYELVLDSIPFTLEIEQGNFTLRNLDSNTSTTLRWDGDYDLVESLDADNAIIRVNIKDGNIFPNLEIVYNILLERIFEVIYIDADNNLQNFDLR